MKKRSHTLIGEGIDESIGNIDRVDIHEIIDDHHQLFLVFVDAFKILHLEFLFTLELKDGIDDMPILFQEITFMNIIGYERKTDCKLSYLGVIYFYTG